MKTVILSGGYGTRIRDVSDNLPKPMIPVGKFPILWHLMKYYAKFGHKDFILCLGYKAHVIKEFFLNYETQTRDFTISLGNTKKVEFHTDHEEEDWKVTLADTGMDAMTGARIKRIKKYLGNDKQFFLTYGDGLSNVDLNRLLKFHNEHGKVLTVTGVRPPGRFGELMSDDKGIVTEFNEKPQATGGRISGGFFVCNTEIFNFLGDNEDLIFEQGPMRELVAQQQLAVYEHDDFWQCMDTHRDWQYLNQILEKGKAPWI